MKSLKYRVLAVFSLFAFVAVLAAPIAEARIGGGRSSGFRGSRSFGTRSAPYSAPNRYQAPPQSNYGNSSPPGAFGNAAPQSSGFGRNLLGGIAGGIAGGMIGSMLARSLGFAGAPGVGGFGGGGGIGFFEILLFVGLGYLAYRMISARRAAAAGSRPTTDWQPSEPSRTDGYSVQSAEPARYSTFGSGNSGGATSASGEYEAAQALSQHDPRFDLTAFKEERMDDFMALQGAWNHRDLSGVSNLVAQELRQQLDADIQQLKMNGRINKIENIAVRSTDLIEAWREQDREYATLRFRANLVDYTVDEKSGQVVAGDPKRSTKFEEDWTFVRPVGSAGPINLWKVTAIEA